MSDKVWVISSGPARQYGGRPYLEVKAEHGFFTDRADAEALVAELEAPQVALYEVYAEAMRTKHAKRPGYGPFPYRKWARGREDTLLWEVVELGPAR